MSLKGKTSGNGQMDRILMILKKKFTLHWGYIHTCIHMNIIYSKTNVLVYTQISGEHLQDHWSSGFISDSKCGAFFRLMGCKRKTRSYFTSGVSEVRF